MSPSFSVILLPWILGWVASVALAVPGAALAQMLTVEETEALVRATYFEGMPEDEASRIGPEGAARLVAMLVDPAERDSHAQILLALGLSGPPGALAAIRAWLDAPMDREIDRQRFRAWQALPYALGHLARHDAQALGALEAFMNADPPSWSFRHHRGARLHRLARRSAATALALTGLPEAGRALDRASRRASDADFDSHLQDVRALLRDRSQEASR